MDDIGLEINKTSKKVRRGMETWMTQIEDKSITPRQGRLLGHLHSYPDANSSDIQEAFGLSKSTVSELISSLVEKGYLTYEKDEGDGRQRKIILTEKGQEHVREAHRLTERYEKRLVKGMSQEEVDTLYRLLMKVKANAKEVLHEERKSHE